MKLKEIAVEEELLMEGNHPDYHSKMQEFNVKRDRRLFRARSRYCLALETIENTFQSDLKLLMQTLVSKKRELQELFIRKVVRQKYSTMNGNFKKSLIGKFSSLGLGSMNPVILRAKRIELVNNQGNKPEWISQLIRKRKRSGFSKVFLVNADLNSEPLRRIGRKRGPRRLELLEVHDSILINVFSLLLILHRFYGNVAADPQKVQIDK